MRPCGVLNNELLFWLIVMTLERATYIVAIVLAVALNCRGDEHSHGTAPAANHIQPPKVFLDKIPRIVEYQLGRLENARLLLVDRNPGGKKYVPVYEAILSRPGLSPQDRSDAVDALVKLNQSDPVSVLLAALEKIDADDRDSGGVARGLAEMLVQQPQSILQASADRLLGATSSANPFVRSVGYAALVAADRAAAALEKAHANSANRLDWLRSVPLIPMAELRATLRDPIVSAIKQSPSTKIQVAAIDAIGLVPTEQQETFALVAPLAADPSLRSAAVNTLLTIENEYRDPKQSAALLGTLVGYAEKTPARQRTGRQFTAAMQLADSLMALVPNDIARGFRKRLEAVIVRLVRIKTVEEEMRYDTPYFCSGCGTPSSDRIGKRRPDAAQLGTDPPGSPERSRTTGIGGWPQGDQGPGIHSQVQQSAAGDGNGGRQLGNTIDLHRAETAG